jgi:hypothetical protein
MWVFLSLSIFSWYKETREETMIFSSGARQASTAIFARRQAYEREGGERERERERPRELDGDCFVYGRNNPWKY